MGYPNYPDPVTEQLDTDEGPRLKDLSGTYSTDPSTDAIYKESRVQQAMHIVNNIRGIEFESFEDWMNHVNIVDTRIKQG